MDGRWPNRGGRGAVAIELADYMPSNAWPNLIHLETYGTAYYTQYVLLGNVSEILELFKEIKGIFQKHNR